MTNNPLTLIVLFFLSAFTTHAEAKGQILVYSQTNGYRHEVIPTGISALNEMAKSQQWEMSFTEDSTVFTAKKLKVYDVVVFLATSGDLFTTDQKTALKNYIEKGGTLLTIHSGTNTEENWEWWVNAIGARFIGHPPTQKARVIIEDRNHPATAHFTSDEWITTDEWYSFDRNPRQNVKVLISIDENSYGVADNRWFEGVEQQMGDHPITWYKNVGKGIVFQTAFGHTPEMYADPLFKKHLTGTINWLISEKN